ncbi:MAG: efflux RND transporter permease subunit [Pirellulaceae bacterium]|nr:efflux RND transporter permease subunit [Pirellulaceae bacterium]
MGRAEDPSFTIKTAIVSANWPGASAEQMQRQVAERVEDKLRQTPHLDFVRTYCLPERMLILVQLKDTVDRHAVADIWYQARKKLNDIRATLPQGVLGPEVNDEYGDVYSSLYALTGKDFSPAELKRVAERMRKRLLRVADVEKVDFIGDLPQKVYVEISHAKLASLGVSPQTIFDSVARQNSLNPAGKIETGSDRIYIRVGGEFDVANAIADVPIAAAGRLLRLGDIAEIRRGYRDPAEFTVRYNGQPALGLGVVMRKGGNVLAMGDALQNEMKLIADEIPLGVEVGTIAYQPAVVAESVGEFTSSFVEALIIVLVVSFLSLGVRTGIVVALSVPSVLALSLIVMHAMGMDLDRISLGALILALGLLVDDAIIAVEMMAVKLEQGFSRHQAATFAWTSTAFPMLSGTLITAAGFLPVGFANSAAGEYAGGIFWVVGIALICSWLVAVMFTPYLGVKLLPEKLAGHAQHEAYNSRFYRLLRSIITTCVRHPLKVVGTTVVAFCASMFGFTQLQQQFFPQSSRPELSVDIKLADGSSFEATADIVGRIEALLQPERQLAASAQPAGHRSWKLPEWLSHSHDASGQPDVLYFTSYTGAGAARFFLALNPDLPNPSFAKIVIQTSGVQARERLRKKLIDRFANDPQFAAPRIRVLRLDFGPPVGYPVQFRVMGPDPDQVQEIAGQVREIVRQEPTAVDVNLEWTEPSKVVRMEVDQDRARSMGLNSQEISSALQTLLSGVPIAQFREGTETVEVVVRAIEAERLSLEHLPDLSLFTSSGRAVPLGQVAKLSAELEAPIVWRRNQESMLTVQADIQDGMQAPDVTNRIFPRLKELIASLPPGYRIERGGATEESEKANKALFAMFPVMILVMLTLLMLQVQSFKKAALVFGIAPLGLIGAVTFLYLFQAPFGFVALLGVIALAGMDMRNSIILIDQIDQDQANGLSEWEAVIESAVRRARPVVLTAATAILAMIPLTRSVFWGPMAIAIMGGLSVATFLTLINLPALYILIFRVKRPEVPKEMPPKAARPSTIQAIRSTAVEHEKVDVADGELAVTGAQRE